MEAKSTFKYFFKTNPVEVVKPKNFSTPRLVAYFEVEYEKLKPGHKILYFREPKRSEYPLDLNIGYDKYITRKSYMYHSTSLKYALSSIADDAKKVDCTMVYTRRGALTNIMQSNYLGDRFNSLSFRVSRYDGNIYMIQEDKDESELRKPPFRTHHYRLGKVLFAESPYETSHTPETCDENVKLVAVHRSNLGKYDIVYSGEVQGIIAEEKFKDFDDIEALNDCRFVLTKQMWQTCKGDEKKLLNYWLQAYLANVQDLYLAYKDKAGVVKEPISHKSVPDLPKNCFWKPKICTAFLQYFLESVEKIMSIVNCLNTVYVFKFNSNNEITYKIYNGKSDKTFISKEYMDFIKK